MLIEGEGGVVRGVNHARTRPYHASLDTIVTFLRLDKNRRYLRIFEHGAGKNNDYGHKY